MGMSGYRTIIKPKEIVRIPTDRVRFVDMTTVNKPLTKAERDENYVTTVRIRVRERSHHN